jgi:hypothetical protein
VRESEREREREKEKKGRGDGWKERKREKDKREYCTWGPKSLGSYTNTMSSLAVGRRLEVISKAKPS